VPPAGFDVSVGAADLFTPAAGQGQQFDNAAKVVIRAGIPHGDQLMIGKGSLTRLNTFGRIIGEKHRIGTIPQPFPRRPRKHRRQIAARARKGVHVAVP